MIIQNNTIEPGQNAVLRLSVGRLPSDTKIYLNVHVFRSTAPGPAVLIMAGVHGDEINSVEIVRRTLAQRWFEGLQRGSVVVIPLLNVYGFNNFSREVPDGKDVNRSFPGSANGSMAARVAHIFTKHILPVIDFGVDFHTGGNNNYNYPQIRYSTGHARSRELADAFAAPFSISYKPIAKSLRKTALDAGKPILVYEGGENLRFDPLAIEHGLAGIRRLLYAEDMLPEVPPPTTPSIQLTKMNWMRTDRSGIFHALKKSGDTIKPGERLAVVNDPYGMDEIPVVAKKAGYIIGHNNNPVVGMGDALFHIGV
ncbi:MAG: succinylglutamate desuccinylase/aspartoacylase family protein [Saprospiraceae bacterium]|nr:succinylglutamate desuccinylase/aspartoacylase family protein [Saprospiraceae bacterium]MCF8251697.1 succinylglutamate desuccinylase/aspartoacylase family protein [Saprospiraceae bacterium]MCF8281079.1 succinylglutamate desuccinylase/aspartoacylase family protein [Bacteroidales bacterium]MCF8311751.1 succinylglutamate desuccinylase/aspartoacylase family protein [Saprospiraceae bacterium]MCF8441799.1 succinylglutamate desuccinylase/aspartoacylase family protein [Saprospiraceae bacterium]